MHEGKRARRAAHPRATFAELEGEATRQVAALRAELIRIALEDGEPEVAPDCAARGRAKVRDGTRTRTISTNHEEQMAVTGQRYRCPACGARLSPPD